jgi:hypothetical protein
MAFKETEKMKDMHRIREQIFKNCGSGEECKREVGRNVAGI